ncbi:MAG: outer membrane protein assembly factor BamD [Rhabdochlamydiaceae bacterium]|nr:outer membrane protein assembly factor BamD [Candidatus Amphrikana amoebophyrae]
MNIKFKHLILLFLATASVVNAKSALVAKRESLDRIEERRLQPQDYYGIVSKSFEDRDFNVAIANSYKLLKEYPSSVLASETIYMQALSFYESKEYHLADVAFTRYLHEYSSLKHFEDAISYKFKIAEKFGSGARKRLFGGRLSPKWLSAKEDALRIYDEVITTLPRNELAAMSLYNKGLILLEIQSFKEAVESFQTLVKRFPKHPLAPECYIAISQTYLDQCNKEFPDPNLIELAEINLQRFSSDFPGEERLSISSDMLEKMRNTFAKELFVNAKYYEKKKKAMSAFLYYSSILMKYPTSKYSEEAAKRIAVIKSNAKNPDEFVL